MKTRYDILDNKNIHNCPIRLMYKEQYLHGHEISNDYGAIFSHKHEGRTIYTKRRIL